VGANHASTFELLSNVRITFLSHKERYLTPRSDNVPLYFQDDVKYSIPNMTYKYILDMFPTLPQFNSPNPLNVLEQNGYNVNSFTYPVDLGNDPGEPHCIVFYINESGNTQYTTAPASNSAVQLIQPVVLHQQRYKLITNNQIKPIIPNKIYPEFLL